MCPAQIPRSIMSDNQQGILIATVKSCQVFKALTMRTELLGMPE